MAERIDLEIWRGADAPRQVFRPRLNGAASAWRMTIATPVTKIVLSTEEGSITAEAVVVDGEVRTLLTVILTKEQTRQIPLGQLTSYELEQVEPTGGERVWASGMITGLGGLNSDGD